MGRALVDGMGWEAWRSSLNKAGFGGGGSVRGDMRGRLRLIMAGQQCSEAFRAPIHSGNIRLICPSPSLSQDLCIATFATLGPS